MRRGVREPEVPGAEESTSDSQPSLPPDTARRAPAKRDAPATATRWVPDRLRSLARWRPRGVLVVLVLLIVGLGVLTIGGANRVAPRIMTSSVPTKQVDATAWPTPSPRPTATPAPTPPLPQFVPQGWQIYRDHHFAVAFPAGWIALEHVVVDASGKTEAASVSFNSPDDTETVAISEHEALDVATLQQFCAESGTPVTYAGLPMLTSRMSATVRMFVFASTGDSTGGVVYTLLYSEENTPLQLKWLYDSILATFRPEYPTPACH